MSISQWNEDFFSGSRGKRSVQSTKFTRKEESMCKQVLSRVNSNFSADWFVLCSQDERAAQGKTCVVCFPDSHLNKQISHQRELYECVSCRLRNLYYFQEDQGVGKFCFESERTIAFNRKIVGKKYWRVSRNVSDVWSWGWRASSTMQRWAHVTSTGSNKAPPVEANAVETLRSADVLITAPLCPLSVNRPPVSS